MTLAERLAKDVPMDVRNRGAIYFQSGNVRITDVGSMSVEAEVTGSEVYIVDLTLKNQKVFCYCTCPYIDEFGLACKHIWATVLAAQARGFARGVAAAFALRLILDVIESDIDHEPADDRRWRQPAPPRQPLKSSKPQQPTWQQQFKLLGQELQATSPPPPSHHSAAKKQLCYVIDQIMGDLQGRLNLEINFQERKKNGEWSKPKDHHVSRENLDSLEHPIDRQILTLLAGASRSENYHFYESQGNYGTVRYSLNPALLDAIRPLLVEANRLYFRSAMGPRNELQMLVADVDPPWTLSLGVKRHEKHSQWILRGQLSRGSETMPLSVPALIVPGVIVGDGRFGRFDDAGSFAWVKALRKVPEIAVPESKSDELLQQLLAMPNLPRVELPPELAYEEVAGLPRPRIVIKPAKMNWGNPPLSVILSFEYDGQVVPVLPKTRGIYRNEGRRYLLRDKHAEYAAEDFLLNSGVRRGQYTGETSLELNPKQLPRLVQTLVAAGWKVEAEGKLYRQPGVFDIAVKSNNDWFDLHATANYDGQHVPFPRLLEALRKGETSIVLDDGSLGMVPEDWLKKYGLIAQMGTLEGDAVRFHRAQVGVLDALLASRPEIEFDKQFAKARDELRKFDRVAATDPPKSFTGELREYQREGLGWLRFLRKFGFGGCLADDMGLGKTVQVLAMLASKRKGPALVIVPKSLIFNWNQEAAKFTPKLKVLDHTGITRDKTGSNFKDFDIILTTYGTLRNDAAVFAEMRFDTCILDESQAAKNAATETAKAVRLIQADHRLAMSGTPVENHLGELWTLFDFLNPGMLGRAAIIGSGPIRNPDPETREILAKALRPFILRRTKSQVAKDLPEKTEQTVFCNLEPEQRQLYDELRDHYRKSLLSRVDTVGIAKSKIHVLEALLRLRQAACHAGLVDKSRKAETSAKLEVLLPQLRELAEGGSKVLVFSQFTSLLSIVRDRLDAEALAYEYLDGKTRNRSVCVDRFQNDPACKLFLISLKAGGVGLNLTAAEYVFLLDPWWNPAVEAQAIDRSHRIGQTKPVFAYRLIARGTVEEKVLALQQSKRELADAILGGDGNLITDLKREDLELLLS